MAQTYTTDPYAGTGKTADAVMEDVNENFAALKSGFAGTSAPASPVGGQQWHDSTARKVRNYANDEWLASLLGDASQKMPVYRNDTCEGWLIDTTSATDRVLAFKGGSTYLTGGANAGSWVLSGLATPTIPASGWGQVGPGAYPGYLVVGNAGSSETVATGHAALSITSTGAWRIAAAVMTLQYPDLS